jgi:phosphatidylethanolamine-binding protein (PEBP) family uncharacterized protein
MPRIKRIIKTPHTKIGLFATLALVAFAAPISAHPPGSDDDHHHDAVTQTWHDLRNGVQYEASLMNVRADGVTIELDDGALVSIPMADLSQDDRAQAESKLVAVRAMNEYSFAPPTPAVTKAPTDVGPWQASSFVPFAPFVRTRSDAQWLYVESDGMPHAPVDFTMMVGIRAWQQQVPIPQSYTGANAWQIPLQPTLAENPVSGKTGLRRGAIALAANGIPIFNAYNNRGEDSFAIGELDEFGGHCGRGDDYHYHAAPLALQKVVGAKNPIAFALDGFAIYGLFDAKAKPGADNACPLGATAPLDEWNGHECTVPAGQGIDGGTRSYHYHASVTYPYINGGMRGNVTVNGDEITPQAHATPFRPSLQPLRGASIIGFKQTAPKAWSLSYQVAGKTSRIDYSIDESGKVNFIFVDSNGKTKEESYSRQSRGGGQGGGGKRGGQGDRQGGGGRQRDESKHTIAPTKDGFIVHSAGIGADGMLAKKYTCDGESIAPPIDWSGLPAATKSVAIAMHHIPPSGKEGLDEHAYIVLWGIPVDTKALAESQHDVGTWGINTVNRRAEYAPPCSQGPGEKSYIVTVYALSAQPKLAAGRAGFTDLLAAIKDTTLSIAEVELRYARDRGGENGAGGDDPPPPPPDGQNGKGDGGKRGGQGGGGQGGKRKPPQDGMVKPAMSDTIHGSIYADNWFAMYINGKLVAVDSIDFLPHNVVNVDILPDYPMTIAVLAKDNADPKTGCEYGKQIGDGGFILKFADGTVTDAKWKAKCFSYGPIDRNTTEPKVRTDPLPEGWQNSGFDDSTWSNAVEYTQERIDPKEPFFQNDFKNAKWIWTSDLDLDNTVILRCRIDRAGWKPRWNTNPDLDVSGPTPK